MYQIVILYILNYTKLNINPISTKLESKKKKIKGALNHHLHPGATQRVFRLPRRCARAAGTPCTHCSCHLHSLSAAHPSLSPPSPFSRGLKSCNWWQRLSDCRHHLKLTISHNRPSARRSQAFQNKWAAASVPRPLSRASLLEGQRSGKQPPTHRLQMNDTQAGGGPVAGEQRWDHAILGLLSAHEQV